MSLTWQTGCFGSILLERIILPWNKVRFFVHLLGMRGQGPKTMYLWMQRFWLTPWFNYNGMIRRPMPTPRAKQFRNGNNFNLMQNAPHQFPNLVLVRLTSSHLTNILGILKWGVGSIPFHVLAKIKEDEDLASLIHESKVAWPVSLFAFHDLHVNHIIIFSIYVFES